MEEHRLSDKDAHDVSLEAFTNLIENVRSLLEEKEGSSNKIMDHAYIMSLILTNGTKVIYRAMKENLTNGPETSLKWLVAMFQDFQGALEECGVKFDFKVMARTKD